MSQSEANLSALFDDLEEKGRSRDAVSVGDMMDAAGNRGTGIFILVPAIVAASPVGMIPTVPTVAAVIVAIFAIQILIGRERLWLPGWLKDREVESDKYERGLKKAEPWFERLDKWFGSRLKSLAGDKGTRIAAGVVLVICVAVPPLELVPGAALLPMLAITVFGLALALRDGVLMLFAYALTAVAAYAAVTLA